MSIDHDVALESSKTLHELANLIPTLQAHLRPGGSKVEALRTAPASRPPINLAVSDLLAEIDAAVDFWIGELMEDRHDFVPANSLEGRLDQVADAYGHFTTNEDVRRIGMRHHVKDGEVEVSVSYQSMAQDFCDEVHELMRKATGAIAKPLPPAWMGPCSACDDGQMYLMSGRSSATCNECGTDVDLVTWRKGLIRAMESRLMKRPEIRPALSLLCSHGMKPPSTEAVHKWVQRGRLVPVIREPEMFRLTDAMDLAGIEVA